jgi:DeoR family transcriptional regulator, aga operon transcriptional repressor
VIGERRRRDIQARVEQTGYVEARQLATELMVDVSTIRRDLDALARLGLVQRTHGGALPLSEGQPIDLPYEVKKRERLAEKRAIAAYAASLVTDGSSLVLDSGSTTYALAEAIRDRRDLTVATNDLRIAHHLAAAGGLRLFVTGGQLIDSVFTLVGPGALANLAGLHVDWAFLGADAIDADAGVTNVNTVEIPIKQAMLESGARKVLLADSSKFGRQALARVVGNDAFDFIVTDAGLAPQMRSRFGRRLVCLPVRPRQRARGASGRETGKRRRPGSKGKLKATVAEW